MTKAKDHGICAFCQNPSVLRNSHIQPRWLYRERGSDIKLISTNSPFESRSPIGPYEKLLCDTCEGLMGVFDDYSAEFFKGSNYWPRDERTNWRVIYTYDYEILKLFMLSILWRAGAARGEYFSQVVLDTAIMTELKKMIESKNPGGEQDFSVMISMRNKADGLEKVGWNPFTVVKKDNLTWAHFDLNEFGCDIKLGREHSEFCQPVYLKEKPPLFVVTGPTFNERLLKMKNHSLDRQERERQFKEDHKKK